MVDKTCCILVVKKCKSEFTQKKYFFSIIWSSNYYWNVDKSKYTPLLLLVSPNTWIHYTWDCPWLIAIKIMAILCFLGAHIVLYLLWAHKELYSAIICDGHNHCHCRPLWMIYSQCMGVSWSTTITVHAVL